MITSILGITYFGKEVGFEGAFGRVKEGISLTCHLEILGEGFIVCIFFFPIPMRSSSYVTVVSSSHNSGIFVSNTTGTMILSGFF